MATDIGVGDVEVPRLAVSPYDETTAVTLTVSSPPDGAETVMVPYVEGADGNTQTWVTTPVTYTAPGRWVLTWEVTGTGAGREQHVVYVPDPPTAGGPTWTPGRSRVAAYVPTRTLARSRDTVVGSQDQHVLTFDQTTRPTGVMVDRLIADGVAWVAAAVPQVPASLRETASVAAALWAASAVERGWPETDASAARADALWRQAEQVRADVVAATGAETGTTPGQARVSPVWSFPNPVSWGDSHLL